jgi:hypothetical protein
MVPRNSKTPILRPPVNRALPHIFDRSLWIGHNKINLAKGPTENDTEDYHEPDGEPCHNRCVGFEIVHSVDLLSAVEVQLCLV